MRVVLHRVCRGQRYAIYALEERPVVGENVEPNRPLEDFLNELEASDADEHARLVRLLEFVADNEPPRNKEKCRPVTKDLFEFKTRGGVRVLWFYDANRLIICTHGFPKSQEKRLSREVKRAEEWMNKYKAARQTQQVIVIEETIL
jgi:phage-related protein